MEYNNYNLLETKSAPKNHLNYYYQKDIIIQTYYVRGGMFKQIILRFLNGSALLKDFNSVKGMSLKLFSAKDLRQICIESYTDVFYACLEQFKRTPSKISWSYYKIALVRRVYKELYKNKPVINESDFNVDFKEDEDDVNDILSYKSYLKSRAENPEEAEVEEILDVNEVLSKLNIKDRVYIILTNLSLTYEYLGQGEFKWIMDETGKNLVEVAEFIEKHQMLIESTLSFNDHLRYKIYMLDKELLELESEKESGDKDAVNQSKQLEDKIEKYKKRIKPITVPPREIAGFLGVSTGALTTQISRIKAKLCEDMSENKK